MITIIKPITNNNITLINISTHNRNRNRNHLMVILMRNINMIIHHQKIILYLNQHWKF